MKQTKIIPFDLSLVTDDNVFTTNNYKVRIICTDRHSADSENIVALITDNDGEEFICTYNNSGKYYPHINHDYDLVIHKEMEIVFEFKPFQKVLVRNNEHDIWRPALFSHESKILYSDETTRTVYYIIGERRRSFVECLPYDKYENICNTTDNPVF